jgi:hypothetical protein
MVDNSEVILPSFADQALPTRFVSDSTQAFMRWVVVDALPAVSHVKRSASKVIRAMRIGHEQFGICFG